MLEEDAIIFFVNADCVLDRVWLAVPCMQSVSFLTQRRWQNLLANERSIKILDRSLAITAHGELIGHVTCAIFAQVKSVLAVMWVVRVAIGHDHLSK